MERLLDQLKTHQKHLLYAVTGLLFTIFLVIAAHTEGSYGGADSFQHYLISRYSWKHPHLLLDHWGKPLFTLLSSLFSQFGFYGIQCFNILIGMITAWLTYKVLEHLNVKLAPFAVIFVVQSVSRGRD
jgi:ABC-type cobalt transport system substrate-binding protein